MDLAPFSSFVREDPELFAEMAEELDEETRARFASQIQAQKDWHEPSAALATIEGLLAHLRKADAKKLPADFHEAESEFAVRAVLQNEGQTLVEAVCKELQDCAEQLRQALKQVPFRHRLSASMREMFEALDWLRCCRRPAGRTSKKSGGDSP